MSISFHSIVTKHNNHSEPSFVELFQNKTIEERVALLEIQVVEIEEDVNLVQEDINFLFDETVIQDERLFTLEQTTIAINAELVTVDDELEGLPTTSCVLACFFQAYLLFSVFFL